MKRLRRGTRRRIAASIACLAFLLHGIVPSLAHAMAGTARTQFLPGPLCSIDPEGALQRLEAAIDAQAPAPAPLPKAAHCPFCALPFGAEGPAPTWSWDFREIVAGILPLIVSAEAPATHPSRGRPHAPRAPPGA